jgi:hypothetical protein
MLVIHATRRQLRTPCDAVVVLRRPRLLWRLHWGLHVAFGPHGLRDEACEPRGGGEMCASQRMGSRALG